MKFSKKFALHEAAAQDPSRYAVQGIRVMKQKGGQFVAEATDGRIMARVPVEDGNELAGRIMAAEAWAAAQRIARKPGKRDSDSELTATINIGPSDGPAQAFKVWDHKAGAMLNFPELDARFPDTDGVVPRAGKVLVRVGLDPELLLKLAKAIGAAGASASGMHAVVLTVYEDAVELVDGVPETCAPILVTQIGATDPTGAVGVIMPVSTTEKG